MVGVESSSMTEDCTFCAAMAVTSTSTVKLLADSSWSWRPAVRTVSLICDGWTPSSEASCNLRAVSLNTDVPSSLANVTEEWEVNVRLAPRVRVRE